MQIKVSARHTDLSVSLREFAEEKVGKLVKFYDRLMSVDVVFDLDAGMYRCELIAKADHHNTFVAREENKDPQASLDAAVKDVERQLTRHKERFRNRKHPAARADKEGGGLPDEGGPA
jgi:putative sigma-54 modulation protein